MEKILKQQATKLQRELNKRESGDFKYTVKSLYVNHEKWTSGYLELKIKDNTTKKNYTYTTVNVCEDFESNIKNLIYMIYEDDIKFWNRVPNRWKGYVANYMNSLEKAFANADDKKLLILNKKIIEQYGKVKELREKVEYYMHFVRLLYKCRDQLCPSKKII